MTDMVSPKRAARVGDVFFHAWTAYDEDTGTTAIYVDEWVVRTVRRRTYRDAPGLRASAPTAFAACKNKDTWIEKAAYGWASYIPDVWRQSFRHDAIPADWRRARIVAIHMEIKRLMLQIEGLPDNAERRSLRRAVSTLRGMAARERRR